MGEGLGLDLKRLHVLWSEECAINPEEEQAGCGKESASLFIEAQGLHFLANFFFRIATEMEV